MNRHGVRRGGFVSGDETRPKRIEKTMPVGAAKRVSFSHEKEDRARGVRILRSAARNAFGANRDGDRGRSAAVLFLAPKRRSRPRGADPPIRGANRVRSGSRGRPREQRSESLSRTKRKIAPEGCGSSDPRRESSSERIERMPVGEAKRVSFSHQKEDRARGVRILRSAARIEFGANREDACGRSEASLFLAPKRRSCPRGADPPIRGANRVRSESRGCLREKRSESLSRTKTKIVPEGCGSSDPRRESSSERIERTPAGAAQRVSFSHQKEDRVRGVRILRSAARNAFEANRDDACGSSAASLFLARKGRSCPRGADPPIRGANHVRSGSRRRPREKRSGSLSRTKRKIVPEGCGSSDPRRESSSERIETATAGEAQRVSFSHQNEDRARGVRILRSAARIEFGANREDACGRSEACSARVGSSSRRNLRSDRRIVQMAEGCGSSDPRRESSSERIETTTAGEAQRVSRAAQDAPREATRTVIVVDATTLAADRRIRTPCARERT